MRNHYALIMEEEQMMGGKQSLDLPTKIMLIILVVIVSYLVMFLILTGLFVQQPFSMYDMMQHMMSLSQSTAVVNLVAISLALLAGMLVSLWLKTEKTEATTAKTDEPEIIKRVLSDDEKSVLDEISRAGEITQDSLRFRLDWSKAKLSRILTSLDKMNLIQRERMGKTYNVFLTGERK